MTSPANNNDTMREYVITKPASSRLRIPRALRRVAAARLLDQLDGQTALVEMTPDARDQLAERYPELSIEPNIRYEVRAASVK